MDADSSGRTHTANEERITLDCDAVAEIYGALVWNLMGCESLGVRIRGETCEGYAGVEACYQPADRVRMGAKPSLSSSKKPPCHRPWVL